MELKKCFFTCFEGKLSEKDEKKDKNFELGLELFVFYDRFKLETH